MSAPYGLTVRKLKEVLASMPESYDDRIVVMASDAEGNDYDTLCAIGVGWYRDQYEGQFQGASLGDDDTWEKVDAEVTRSYLVGEDWDEEEEGDLKPEEVELDEHDHPAICLWP